MTHSVTVVMKVGCYHATTHYGDPMLTDSERLQSPDAQRAGPTLALTSPGFARKGWLVSAGSRKKSNPYDQSDTGGGPEPDKVPTLPQEALSHGAHGLFGNIRRHRAAGETGVAVVSSGGIHYLVFALCPSLYHQFFFPYSCFPGWQHPQPHKVLLHNLWTLCPRDPGL